MNQLRETWYLVCQWLKGNSPFSGSFRCQVYPVGEKSQPPLFRSWKKNNLECREGPALYARFQPLIRKKFPKEPWWVQPSSDSQPGWNYAQMKIKGPPKPFQVLGKGECEPVFTRWVFHQDHLGKKFCPALLVQPANRFNPTGGYWKLFLEDPDQIVKGIEHGLIPVFDLLCFMTRLQVTSIQSTGNYQNSPPFILHNDTSPCQT